MCIVDRLEEQKRNSVIVLGILFLCLDFFFSHVAEGVKTYLVGPVGQLLYNSGGITYLSYHTSFLPL